MVTEINITIKTEESNHKVKFLEYEAFNPNDDNDPVLSGIIDEALSKIKVSQDEIDSIIVRTVTVRK